MFHIDAQPSNSLLHQIAIHQDDHRFRHEICIHSVFN